MRANRQQAMKHEKKKERRSDVDQKPFFFETLPSLERKREVRREAGNWCYNCFLGVNGLVFGTCMQICDMP